MLNILLAKNKCNIVNYKLNVYKTSTKQPWLSYNSALHKTSIFRIRYCQNLKYVTLVLLHYKETLQIFVNSK